MTQEPVRSIQEQPESAMQRIEVSFVGSPPAANRLERAAGVSEVRVDGSVVHCVVHGSFQPFLEALRGYEVVSLTSVPITGERGVPKGK